MVTPELSGGESQTLHHTATLAPQIATPQTTSELPPPLEIQSSRDNPILDTGEIVSILESLQLREEAWFSRPGWYQVTYGDGTGEFGHDVFLTHVINEKRECRERLFYFNKQGQVWPYIIRLEDGALGSYNPVWEGKFRRDTVQPASMAVPCDLGNGESIWVGTEEADFLLHDEALHFSQPDNPNLDLEMITQIDRGWIEKISGGDVFVWEREIEYVQPSPSVSGIIVDPQTGAQQTIARRVERVFVDLVTGLQMKTEEDFYLVNGSVIDGSHDIITQYEYWETLPIELAEVYNKMAADLRLVLDK